jgi:hypothetical protein
VYVTRGAHDDGDGEQEEEEDDDDDDDDDDDGNENPCGRGRAGRGDKAVQISASTCVFSESTSRSRRGFCEAGNHRFSTKGVLD